MKLIKYQDTQQRLPVEIHIVDTAQVPRQFVNQLLTVHIPNVHIPGWQTFRTTYSFKGMRLF